MDIRPHFAGLAVIAVVAGAACAPTEPAPSQVCPQTYEFGNYGCAVVTGRVLDLAAQPIANASVGPRSSADGYQFNTPYATTLADGRFTVQLTRFFRGSGDSVTIWLRAATRPPPHPDSVGISDSVQLRLRVSPVGELPDTARVDFVLPRL